MTPDPVFTVDPATGFGAWHDDRIHSTATQGPYSVVCSATREGRDLAVDMLNRALTHGVAVWVEHDDPAWQILNTDRYVQQDPLEAHIEALHAANDGLHIVIGGTLADGFTAYGPFTHGNDAADWATDELVNSEWSLMRLHAPEVN